MKKILCLAICAYGLFAQSSCQQHTIINDGYGDYLLVSSGEFQMGDNYDEGAPHEKPVHTVYLDSYYIGKYEITIRDYEKFVKDGGYRTESYWIAGGYGKSGDLPLYWNDDQYRGGGIYENEEFPVIGVCWYEANAYCMWLSEKTGEYYRLPTEAEWEKAARGIDQRRYPWGDSINGNYANYENSKAPYENITPVGYFDGTIREGEVITRSNASHFGAYDMAGNVWEWCHDWYDSEYYAASPAINPTGPLSGKNKVIRGGSWRSVQSTLRSSNRGGNDPPTLKANTLGFRCVREFRSIDEKTLGSTSILTN